MVISRKFFGHAFSPIALLFAVSACSTPSVKAPIPHESHGYVNGHETSPTDMISGDLCRKRAGQDIPKDWKDAVDIASSCVKEQNWIEVRRMGESLASRDPYAPWGPYFLSVVADSQSQPSKALWMIDLAIRKAPQVGLLYFQKARLLLKADLQNEAVALCDQALRLDSSLSEAVRMLAQVEHRDRNFDRATQLWGKLLDVRPQDTEGLWFRALAAVQIGQVDLALNDLQALSKLQPERREVRFRIGVLLEENKKDLPAALIAYKNAVGIQRPSDNMPLNIEARIKSIEKSLAKPVERAVAAESQKRETKR